MSTQNNNSLMKLISVSLLGILILWLLYALLMETGMSVGAGFKGNYGGGHMYMGTGLGFTGTISALLLFLIKVLFVFFIIGLVIGIAIVIKNYLFTAEDVQQIKGAFTGKRAAKEVCSICSKELEHDWNLCPHCGKEKEIKTV